MRDQITHIQREREKERKKVIKRGYHDVEYILMYKCVLCMYMHVVSCRTVLAVLSCC